MAQDDRIEVLKRGLRKKHYELGPKEINASQYFDEMAKEVLNILDEYYGAARYWMSAEFEREKVLRQMEATIDRIRNADFSL